MSNDDTKDYAEPSAAVHMAAIAALLEATMPAPRAAEPAAARAVAPPPAVVATPVRSRRRTNRGLIVF